MPSGQKLLYSCLKNGWGWGLSSSVWSITGQNFHILKKVIWSSLVLVSTALMKWWNGSKVDFKKKKYLILHLDYIMHLRILPKAGALELHSVYYITFLKLGKELLSILLKLWFWPKTVENFINLRHLLACQGRSNIDLPSHATQNMIFWISLGVILYTQVNYKHRVFAVVWTVEKAQWLSEPLLYIVLMDVFDACKTYFYCEKSRPRDTTVFRKYL